MSDLAAFQQRLGYCFRNSALLLRALTHRSHSQEHNERLEFLGDAVLELSVSHLLYETMGGTEGTLSRSRASLVREESLHQLALGLGLGPELRLGAGEVQAGGRNRASILADALEAVVGAIYLDGGFDAADALVRRLFRDVDMARSAPVASKDPKTALQEWLQARKMELPEYEVLRTLGAAHEQTFEVACRVAALKLQTLGRGRSHRKAEQVAAASMLVELQRSS